MSLLDLEHSGKLCKDLIIYGSNYGSVGASRASPFHLAVHAAFVVVARLVTAAPPSRSQSLRFRIHQRSARAILRMFRLVSSLERIEAVISQRTCAQGLYDLIISYL